MQNQWGNEYDDTVVKSIQLLDAQGQVYNTIAATEGFAEWYAPGKWRVHPDWVPPPEDPPVEA